MIISKNSIEISRVIYKTEGHGKKEHKEPLYTIKIPSQSLLFSVPDGNLVDATIEIIVEYYNPSTKIMQPAKGS